MQEIKKCANTQNLTLIYEEEEPTGNKKARISSFDIPNYRLCPDEYILKLRELRYSENTIKTYKILFEEFINFYVELEIDTIDEQQITTFLRYLVIERKAVSYTHLTLPTKRIV